MAYLAVSIGVPDEEAAKRLSKTLVEERIAAGTRTSSGTSHYWWEGTLHEQMYWTVTAFTTADHLEVLTETVDVEHPDELPGVTYTEIDAREEFLQWIESNTE